MTLTCAVNRPARKPPRAAHQRQARVTALPAARLPRQPGILLVEDDAWVREHIRTELLAYPCAVWAAADGYDALGLYRRHAADIDLVLLDDRMPGLSGADTALGLRRLNPAARYCLMTDSAGRGAPDKSARRRAVLVFQKPFEPAVAAGILWQMVEDWRDAGPAVPAAGLPAGAREVPHVRGLLMNQGVSEDGAPSGRAAAIEEATRRVHKLLHGRLHDFRMLVTDAALVLHGRAGSYYVKQLAQQTVLEAAALPIARNEIEVVTP